MLVNFLNDRTQLPRIYARPRGYCALLYDQRFIAINFYRPSLSSQLQRQTATVAFL